MKSNNRLGILLGLVAALALTGCARYRAVPLNRLQPAPARDSREQYIAMNYKIFDHNDCKAYLDRNVISKGYQPIQIEFINNSNRSFSISVDGLSIPCVPANSIAKMVHTNTAGRAAGYGVAALFIWPFAIPAIVDGIGSAEANEQLDADFAQKTLRNQIITAFGSVNGLVFTTVQNFDPNFTLTVTDASTCERFVLSPTRKRLRV